MMYNQWFAVQSENVFTVIQQKNPTGSSCFKNFAFYLNKPVNISQPNKTFYFIHLTA